MTQSAITNQRRALWGLATFASAAAAVWLATAKDEPPVMSNTPKHTNRLVDETSPYLLQHKHNPVDWYPWGTEALQKAKDESKPIFLSIGYAACHWCHVMEHESFEDESVAAVLNEHFVSIKVDREERPDLDDIYMTAVQMLTGSGGWPMTVFLTPEGKPFFAGTYFPKDDAWGRPGFLSLVKQLATSWDQKRSLIERSSDEITAALLRMANDETEAAGLPGPQTLTAAANSLAEAYDTEHAGFGGAPKFPPSPSVLFLLRHSHLTGDKTSLDRATHTLRRMASGGMYDQIGGGFHRYSVDAEWLVPHFEKMLYDNAQLCSAYCEAYRLTGDPFFERIARDILAYVKRELTAPEGGFYSSEDADSEGQEGTFYIWDAQQAAKLVTEADRPFLQTGLAIQASGNFSSHEPYHRGLNIPHFARPPHELAGDLGIDEAAFWQTFDRVRETLRVERDKRVHPGLDDKILTAWNGLMISAAAQAYTAFGEDEYRNMARRAASFLLKEMRRDGRLLRSHRNGVSKLSAYLDDYIFLIQGLLDLYEADYDPAWLFEAESLADQLVEEYWDEDAGGFFFALGGQSDLIVRMKPSYDGAIPSGNGQAALVLPRLGLLLGRTDFTAKAEQILRLSAHELSQSPRGYMVHALAIQQFLHPGPEIALVGSEEGTADLLRRVRKHYLPYAVRVRFDPQDPNAAKLAAKIPLIKGRELVDGQAAAYVCRNFVCKLPVTSGLELDNQLHRATGGTRP